MPNVCHFRVKYVSQKRDVGTLQEEPFRRVANYSKLANGDVRSACVRNRATEQSKDSKMIVRMALVEDAAGMAELLNHIIAIGGTTAHEQPTDAAKTRHHAIDGPDVLSSVVAEEDGSVVGWQSVEQFQGEPHIGTYVQPSLQAMGIGAELFALTLPALRAKSARYIIASIRADNLPGLAYYARIGFRDIGHEPDFALEGGHKVGRVHRRFDL
jgi:L-amino acid N-acyltransferase YncA